MRRELEEINRPRGDIVGPVLKSEGSTRYAGAGNKSRWATERLDEENRRERDCDNNTSGSKLGKKGVLCSGSFVQWRGLSTGPGTKNTICKMHPMKSNENESVFFFLGRVKRISLWEDINIL